METLFIPNESDFKRWVKEAVRECLKDSLPQLPTLNTEEEKLLNRKEIAKILRVSLVTLTDWMKRGLPYHKQRGKVYFIYSEVMDYIKKYRMKNYLEMG